MAKKTTLKFWTGTRWEDLFPSTHADLIIMGDGQNNLQHLMNEVVNKYNGTYEAAQKALRQVEQVEQIAKGAQQAVSFTDYNELVSVLNSSDKDAYKVGQSIYIETLNVPDLWVSMAGTEYNQYSYTTDEDFVNELKNEGYVEIGYFKLCQLENGKVILETAELNLENGEGAGSLEQKGTVTVGGYSDNIKAQAQGPASVALNGLYSPRQGLTPESDGVIAAGPGSFAGGKDTKAYQACSFAFGGGNKAGLTEDEFNAKYSSGKDAHGKTYAESYSFATAEGVTTKATGYAAHAENESTEATGHRSHASGQETHATGNRSFATGYRTHATNLNSFTIGESTYASGVNSLAGGYNSTSSHYCSLAFGEECVSNNTDAIATGFYTQAGGKYSFAAGRGCFAGGEATMAVGRSNRTTVDYQFACGTYCRENTPNALFVVGNGEDTGSRSNAFVVMKDGRAKVLTAPTENNDVVRKQELDAVASAGGGTKLYIHSFITNDWEFRIIDSHPQQYIPTETIIMLDSPINMFFIDVGLPCVVICWAYVDDFVINITYITDAGEIISKDIDLNSVEQYLYAY